MAKSNICVACEGGMKRWFSKKTFTYWKCSVCGSVTTLPVPAAHSIVDHYKEKFNSGNYLLARQFSNAYLSVYQQFVDLLDDRVKEKKEKLSTQRVLDVGCFTGDFLELLSRKKVDVYGTELQKEAVVIANKKLPGRIFQADIGTRRFPKKKYSVITLLGVIEHVREPQSLIDSTKRVLNSDGLLMIQTPDSGSVLARFMGKWWPPLAPIEHIHIFSADGLTRLLSRHGFIDIRIKSHVKSLPIAYVYRQFSNFGTHFKLLLFPLGWILSRLPESIVLPFYGGEMIVTARLRNK